MFNVTLANGIEIEVHAFERIGDHRAVILAYTNPDAVQPWVSWILDTEKMRAYSGEYSREYWDALQGYRERAEVYTKIPGLVD